MVAGISRYFVASVIPRFLCRVEAKIAGETSKHIDSWEKGVETGASKDVSLLYRSVPESVLAGIRGSLSFESRLADACNSNAV